MGKLVRNTMSKAFKRARARGKQRAVPLKMKRRIGPPDGSLRRRQGESIGAHLNRMMARGNDMKQRAQRRGAAESIMDQIGMGKSASKGKRAETGVGTLGKRMFDKLRQRGRQMTPGQAKAEAMADQAAGRSGRRPPSMGKRGAPQIGDKSLARRDAMRRRAGLGKRRGMAERRPPGMGKRGGMRMQRRPGMGKRGRMMGRSQGRGPMSQAGTIGAPPQRGAMSSVPNMAGGLNQQQENQQVAQRIPAPGLQPSTPMRPPMQPMTPPMAPPMQPPQPFQPMTPPLMLARNPRRRFSLSNPYGA